MKPLVSILVVTYNQERYVRQALDSLLIQKTNFDFEILVHDDHSTDDTVRIIKEYALKHPKIILPMYENNNRFSQGDVGFIKEMLNLARGKYIAICEGDDYWTDSEKLQRQSDYMELNTEVSVSFHPVKVVYEGEPDKKEIYPDPREKKAYNLSELLRGNYIQTNAVMYRKCPYAELRTDITPNDWYLHAFHARSGKIGFINKVMSVYRRHPDSLWSNQQRDMDEFWRKYGLSHLKLYNEFLGLYRGVAEYEQIIASKIGTVVYALSDIDRKSDEGLVRRALQECPDAMSLYTSSLSRAVRSREEEVDVLNHVIEDRDKIIAQRDDEIRGIKNSKFWKLRGIIYKLVRKK